jgi:hypothetical protein
MILIVVRNKEAAKAGDARPRQERSRPPAGRRVVPTINQKPSAIAGGHKRARTMLYIKNLEYH